MIKDFIVGFSLMWLLPLSFILIEKIFELDNRIKRLEKNIND